MSNRTLAILAAIAGIMVIWAVAQSYIANRPPAEPEVPGYLIGGIDPDKIASIRVVTKDEIIRLIRRGTGFVVGNRSDYPAKTGEVNNLIASCLDIKPAEFVTDNKDNHADLGVSQDKARYIVTFFDENAEPITGFYLSPRDPDSGNTYARELTSDRVYRLKEDAFPYLRTMDFVDQELIRAERKDIQQVTVTGPDGTAYTLKRKEPDSDEIVLDNMPAGKKFKGSDYKWVFEALTSLRFDDVKKADDEALKDVKFKHTYVCELKDSTVYILRISKDDDDKYWLTATAEFTDTSEVTMTRGKVESDEELKKKEAKLLGRENAQKFSTRHKGWVYEIPSYKAENLTKALDDLLEDEPKPEPATAESATEKSATGKPAADESATEKPSDTPSSTDKAEPTEPKAQPADTQPQTPEKPSGKAPADNPPGDPQDK